MDLMIRYNDGPGMSSPAGVVVYFGGHLQETKEAGGLEVCPGYLSRDGQVKPEAINADLWREVGWDPAKQELPPPELLRQLSMGYDLEGNKLTQGRGLFRQPKEALITLPAELSQSLKDHPEIARDILRAVVAAHLAEVEREAVRIRVGGGLREWHEARTLSLAYFHAENRGGEVHFHAHTMTFAPAKAADGWRSWDNGQNVAQMSKPGGSREKATDAMLSEARSHGLEVDLRRGVAAKAPGMVQGATVKGLDGQVIEAGSLDRKRRVEILAAQELKRELGGIVPLTPRELEIVRKVSGRVAAQDLAHDLPGERRRLALASKLNDLGMLGEDGRVLPKVELIEKLKGYEQKLAQAQVQLEAGRSLPGTGEKHLAAAHLVQAKREQVAAVAGPGVDLAASTKAARIRWTGDYSRVLLLAHQAGPDGLRTDELNKRDRDLLSKLKGAGHLTGEKEHGRIVYRVSGVGVSKLQELRVERGPLVDSLLPGIRQELQLAAGPGPGPAGGGRGGPGRAPEVADLSTGAGVHRGPDEGGRAGEVRPGAPGLEWRGAEVERGLPGRGDEVGVPRAAALPAVGPEPDPGAGTLRLPPPGAARVDPGPGIREQGHAVPEIPARPDHHPELAAGPGRRLEGDPDPRRDLEALHHGGTEAGAPGRGVRLPAGDIDPGRARREFPALPEPARTGSPRPRAVPLGHEDPGARPGGLGSPDLRPASGRDRGLGGALGTRNPAHHPVAGRSRRGREVERVGTWSTGASDPRTVRGLGKLDLRSAQVAALVHRPGVSVPRGGEPVLLRGIGSVGRGLSVAATVGRSLGEGRPDLAIGAFGSRLAAHAVKRAAQVALELMAPKRVLNPLRALDLPRNMIRQGFEKVWDLGIKTGQQLGQDFTLLTQSIKAAIRGLTKAGDPLELTLEKTLLPRQGPRFGR